MNKIIIVLLVLMPLYMFGQAKVIEPELCSNYEFVHYQPHEFTVFNGRVYVNADEAQYRLELWTFDDVLNSFHMLKDINPREGSSPTIVSTELENVLLFVADDPYYNSSLWSTSGTEASTKKLKGLDFKFKRTNGIIQDNSQSIVLFKNEVYFAASAQTSRDYELWKTDGTSEGTKLVKNINPEFDSNPSNFKIVGNKLIFTIDFDVLKDGEIWSTDGTTENTIKLSDIYAEANEELLKNPSANTHTFFINSTDSKLSLYSTDGTLLNTLKLIEESGNFKINTNSFSVIDTLLYFSCKRDGNISEVWVTNGKKDGTKILTQVSTEAESTVEFILHNDKEKISSFFIVNDNNQNSLWVTDGTELNTIKITPNTIRNIGKETVGNSSRFYFTAKDKTYGNELWITDGTISGTHIVKDLIKGKTSSNIQFCSQMLNNKILFYFTDIFYKIALWTSDGTENGTYKLNKELEDIKDLRLLNSSNNNTVLFKNFEIGSIRLWQTDMTKEGTSIIMPKDATTAFQIGIDQIYNVEFKNHIYFFADYYGKGQQLYRIPNTITSVEDTPQPELMTVYPNPAKDFVQLELTKPMQLSIISSTGAKVKDYGVVADGKLNVAEILPGVYFVVDEQGSNIAKFVKE